MRKLATADRMLGDGKDVADVCRGLGRDYLGGGAGCSMWSPVGLSAVVSFRPVGVVRSLR